MLHDLNSCLAPPGAAARPLYILSSQDEVRARLGMQYARVKAMQCAQRCEDLYLVTDDQDVAEALFICPKFEGRRPEAFGILASVLPPGAWKLDVSSFPDECQQNFAEDVFIGFCMGAYRVALRPTDAPQPRLVVDPEMRSAQIFAEAIWLGRDLINLPANMLSPAELAHQARSALSPLGAQVDITTGASVEQNYPCLAAVGAGASCKSHVVVATWAHPDAGPTAPFISLVGKGVCFDTGGLDIKPSAAMRKMKKDMGGAALMLALAVVLIRQQVPIRLQLRLGCVENSVSSAAMRPGDVLQTRAGLTVEVDNTDAEGRLVLSDLLTEACEANPDYLIDAATLTGAARIALGPDLAALFSNHEALASEISSAGLAYNDPVWRLPLWSGYNAYLTSEIADLANASSSPMAGAITAALFLQKFVKSSVKWAHIDTFAWNDASRPGRPVGGEVWCLHALYRAIVSLSEKGHAA